MCPAEPTEPRPGGVLGLRASPDGCWVSVSPSVSERAPSADRRLCLPGWSLPQRGLTPFPAPSCHSHASPAMAGASTRRGTPEGQPRRENGRDRSGRRRQREPVAGLAPPCPSLLSDTAPRSPRPRVFLCAEGFAWTWRHLSGLKFQDNNNRDFPGRPVVKTLRFHCRGGAGSIPG